jgi:hypothetical protein
MNSNLSKMLTFSVENWAIGLQVHYSNEDDLSPAMPTGKKNG